MCIRDRTKSKRFNGFSFVFGLGNIECQVNLSRVKNQTEQVNINEVGRA